MDVKKVVFMSMACLQFFHLLPAAGDAPVLPAAGDEVVPKLLRLASDKILKNYFPCVKRDVDWHNFFFGILVRNCSNEALFQFFVYALEIRDYEELERIAIAMVERHFDAVPCRGIHNHLNSEVRAFLEARSDYFNYDPLLLTVFDYAFLQGDVQAITILKNAGFDFSAGQIDCIRFAYEAYIKNLRVDMLPFLDLCDVDWKGEMSQGVKTCLHLAVGDLLPGVVEFLLVYRARIDSSDEEGHIPLTYLCVEYGGIELPGDFRANEIARLLIRYGSNVDQQGYYGVSTRQFLIEAGLEDLLERLLGLQQLFILLS